MLKCMCECVCISVQWYAELHGAIWLCRHQRTFPAAVPGSHTHSLPSFITLGDLYSPYHCYSWMAYGSFQIGFYQVAVFPWGLGFTRVIVCISSYCFLLLNIPWYASVMLVCLLIKGHLGRFHLGFRTVMNTVQCLWVSRWKKFCV